ncbi:coniferyl aldehyde dehydrogenase [Vibrio sp. SCSIO 43140]|nr:coniferyl aldehyde dehydrogenase [Vibrio sp. SCSIO 43140]USD59550.1 coniferyl aldehyde dehydrogenase [Vibrio sp. SCSIO 43140]
MQTISNEQLVAIHARLKTHYQCTPMPSFEQRISKLKALKRALQEFSQELCLALDKDYGRRSHQDTLIADVLPCIGNIDHTLSQLDSWMAPCKRNPGPLLSSSTVEVVYQPKGVVGIVTPWNFPVMLSIGPLISAIAAGNLAMIKLSEFTPHTNQTIKKMLASCFSENEVVVIEGEADIAACFTSLPFDHLLFTGSTGVGRMVMKSAAENLTPLTLELGGKSPVIVADDVDIEMAVERIIYGKSLNNGQVCVAPDYVLLPEGKEQAFVDAYCSHYQKLYTNGIDSDNLTGLINKRQFDRVQTLLEHEIAVNSKVVACHSNSISTDRQIMVTHLIVNPKVDSPVMSEEIFGPLLPIITYSTVEQAIAFITARPRPLALYLMSENESLQHKVSTQVHSGGMCINDCVFHLAVDDAPFGGIGESGKGAYHGKEGFLTFSHAKTVMKTDAKAHNVSQLLGPEDNEFKRAVLASLCA